MVAVCSLSQTIQQLIHILDTEDKVEWYFKIVFLLICVFILMKVQWRKEKEKDLGFLNLSCVYSIG